MPGCCHRLRRHDAYFTNSFGQTEFLNNLDWPFSGLKFESLENEISVSVRNWELKTWVLKSTLILGCTEQKSNNYDIFGLGEARAISDILQSCFT